MAFRAWHNVKVKRASCRRGIFVVSMPRLLSLPSTMIAWILLVSGFHASAQTVIVSEVSNGPGGAMEYFEFLVIPDGPVEPCTQQSCLDLRGWIIDDNNGSHGAGGVAQGAARFTNNPLWSCVPVGTLITIYNAEDVNPSVPGNDYTLSDGNCSIVIPSSNFTYLEYSNTTPGIAPCNDPGGWGTDPNPSWASNLALANGGDCVRVSDPAGCLVFSFCYGSVSQNADVHFPGNGADAVWFFNTGDPYNAASWVQGCAGDIAACGSNDQTPGAANSPANAAWLSTFNNGCQPPTVETPLVVTADVTASCGCTGTASASATGSTTPYSFVWYAVDWTPLGVNTDEATDLCGGTYHVIATSASGCSDTATVVVVDQTPPNAGSDGTLALCSDDDATDLFLQLGGTPDPGGTWTPALPGGSIFDPSTDAAGSYTYTISGAPNCPPASAVVNVAVGTVPSVTVNVSDQMCANDANGSIELAFDPAGTYTVTWSDGLPNGAIQNGLSAGTYNAQITSTGACGTTATATVNAPDPLVIVPTTLPAACGNSDGSACATVTGGEAPYSYLWNDPATQTGSCATGIPAGNYSVTVTDANGCTSDQNATVIGQTSNITVSREASDVSCAGEADGAIWLEISPPGEYDVDWNGPDGYTANGTAIEDLEAGNYSFVVTDPLGCSVDGIETIEEPLLLQLDATTQATSCVGSCDGIITPSTTGGTQPWAYFLDQDPITPPLNDICGGEYVLTVRDALGCERSITLTVDEGLAGVVPDLTAIGPFCSDDDAVLLIASPSGGTWTGAGVIANSLFSPNAAGGGTHSLSYTLPCSDPVPLNVQVFPTPNAAFLLPVGEDLIVRNVSTAASIYAWTVNDEPSGDLLDLALAPPEAGGEGLQLDICLIASNQLGCSDTTCSIFTYPTDHSLYVPNAFTPNGDQFNDQFLVAWAGPEPTNFELSIFDRWGERIFTSTNKDGGWDGTTNGQQVPIGVYPWRLQATVQQEQVVLIGHVTVVR